jgi:hypothetical protein
MTDAHLMVDQKQTAAAKYRQFFYNLFDYSVVGNYLKWQIMEKKRV